MPLMASGSLHNATGHYSAQGTKPMRAGPAAPGPVLASSALAPVARRSSLQGMEALTGKLRHMMLPAVRQFTWQESPRRDER